MIYLPLEAVVSIYCDMCKALAQCRACVAVTPSLGDRLGLSGTFSGSLFSPPVI